MQSNIPWIKKAALELQLNFEILNPDNSLGVLRLSKNYYFINCSTPFNLEANARIAKDKYFTYLVFKDTVRNPKTLSFLDPNSPKKFSKFIHFPSIEKIVDETVLKLGENIVVKKNTGQRKENVFFCKNREEITKAFENIFDQNSKLYDYIALAQERIDIDQEFRVIVGFNEILLIYKKWTFEKVVVPSLHHDLENFITKMQSKLDLNFFGLDIAIDKNGKLVLIEINAAPRLDLYINKNINGEREVIDIYKNLIRKFKLSTRTDSNNFVSGK